MEHLNQLVNEVTGIETFEMFQDILSSGVTPCLNGDEQAERLCSILRRMGWVVERNGEIR